MELTSFIKNAVGGMKTSNQTDAPVYKQNLYVGDSPIITVNGKNLPEVGQIEITESIDTYYAT